MERIYLIVVMLIVGIYFINRLIHSKSEVIIHKDFMDCIEHGEYEYKDVKTNYRSAWTEEDKNGLKYYTSDIMDEKTNPGSFFDTKNQFNDSTSPRSSTILPDHCMKDSNEEVVCDFNSKLQNIPPSLIEDKENNPVLKSIGDDKNINTNIISSEKLSVGGGYYNVWEYENEKPVNGGEFFKGVTGYSNSGNKLSLDTIKEVNYAL